MNLNENEYQKIIKDTAAMSREEFKAIIDYWDDEAEKLTTWGDSIYSYKWIKEKKWGKGRSNKSA